MSLSADLAGSFSTYPNPFRPGHSECRVAFYLQAAARVTCEVYSLSGERVIRLLDAAHLTAGMHDELAWDGRNGDGQTVRNGTYLVKVRVDGPGGGEFIRKLAIMR